MRIGISLLGVHRDMGGNLQYAINMLQDLASASSGHKLVVFYDNDQLMEEKDANVTEATYVKLAMEKQNPIRTLARLGIGLRVIKSRPSWASGGYAILDQFGCNVIFHPFWGIGAFITNTPSIAAIHDCLPKEAPEIISWKPRITLDLLIRSIVRNARFILVDSLHGLNLLEKYYSVDSKRVVVLPFKPPKYLMSQSIDDAEAVLVKYNLEPGYLFLPGRWGEYKNTPRVLEALKLVCEKGLAPPKLVLCGIREHELPVAQNEISRLGLQELVHLLGYVPNEDMASLYSEAMALVFPTLLGPTSIPVYEAMALGCPVIVSNISGYPAQVGDAGILVDPFSVSSIAEAITRLSKDPQLRDDLRRKGKKRMDAILNIKYGDILLDLAAKAAL